MDYTTADVTMYLQEMRESVIRVGSVISYDDAMMTSVE